MWLTGRDRLETAGQLGRLGYGGVNRRKDPATTGEIVTRMFISSHRMAEILLGVQSFHLRCVFLYIQPRHQVYIPYS